MMTYNVVPVLCIVDANAIMGKFTGGTADAPTYLWGDGTQDNYVTMVGAKTFVEPGTNGTSELGLLIPQGESIRVMVNTFLPDQFTASLYAINPNVDGVMADAQSVSFEVNLFENNPGNEPMPQSYIDFALQSQVIGGTGSVTGFNVVVQIFDTGGISYGYFFWDPKVTVI